MLPGSDGVDGKKMDYQILLGLSLLAGLVYYFRQAFTSQKNKARIVDLLVVGIILFMSPKIHVYIKTDPLMIAGILVFVYGWGILIRVC